MSWAIWITGLPGSGKTTLARSAAAALAARGIPVRCLELDEVRHVLTPQPAYTETERDLVYRALAYMAKLLVEVGAPVLIDATAHRRRWRELGRQLIPAFGEVELECPLEVCREREERRRGGHAPAAIYAQSGRPGSAVPGVDVPYEPSTRAELTLDTATGDVEKQVQQIVDLACRLQRGVGAPGPRHNEAPMQVRDWMTPSPITVPPGMPVFEARRLMEERHIRHLLITQDDGLLGIVTDRDLRLNLPSPATGLSVWEINYILMKLTVGEVMTKRVLTIEATREIQTAAETMLRHRIGALPVLDAGRLVGIVTETDLLRALVHALGTAPRPPAAGAPLGSGASG